MDLIPNEITENIFTFINTKDLIISGTTVSKKWHNIIMYLIDKRLKSQSKYIPIKELINSSDIKLLFKPYFFTGFHISVTDLFKLYDTKKGINLLNINNNQISPELTLTKYTRYELYSTKYYIGILYHRNDNFVRNIFYKVNNYYYEKLDKTKLYKKLKKNSFNFDQYKFYDILSEIEDFNSIGLSEVEKILFIYMINVQFFKVYSSSYFFDLYSCKFFSRSMNADINDMIDFIVNDPNYYVKRQIYQFHQKLIQSKKNRIRKNLFSTKKTNHKIFTMYVDDLKNMIT